MIRNDINSDKQEKHLHINSIANLPGYILWAFFLALSSYTPLLAADIKPEKPQTVAISLGAEFAEGNYGTDSTTRSLYIPLIATWLPNDRLDISVEVPFIYQNNSNVTTVLYNTSQSATTAKTTLRGGPGGNSGAILQQQSGGGASTAAGSSDSAVSGLGDIILRLGVIAMFEDTNIPQLRPSLYVKCPTADFSDGLGTGEFDFGVGVEVSKWLGNVQLTGEGFYNYQGKVDGFALKNYFSYTTGVGYQLTNSIEPMFVIKGATAPSSYSGALLETRVRVIWSLTDSTSLDLYGSRGIADNSPDYGGGVTVAYSF